MGAVVITLICTIAYLGVSFLRPSRAKKSKPEESHTARHAGPAELESEEQWFELLIVSWLKGQERWVKHAMVDWDSPKTSPVSWS